MMENIFERLHTLGIVDMVDMCIIKNMCPI
jgi:hypothetical protein